jgi:hypothetical protein
LRIPSYADHGSMAGEVPDVTGSTGRKQGVDMVLALAVRHPAVWHAVCAASAGGSVGPAMCRWPMS